MTHFETLLRLTHSPGEEAVFLVFSVENFKHKWGNQCNELLHSMTGLQQFSAAGRSHTVSWMLPTSGFGIWFQASRDCDVRVSEGQGFRLGSMSPSPLACPVGKNALCPGLLRAGLLERPLPEPHSSLSSATCRTPSTEVALTTRPGAGESRALSAGHSAPSLRLGLGALNFKKRFKF